MIKPSGYLNEAAMTRLLDALKHNLIITSLNLSHCRVGDRGVALICESLKMNFSLISIKLKYDAKITDIGAASLASALEINSTLIALDISATEFGHEGRMSLRNAMIWNQTLTYLNLGCLPRSLKHLYVSDFSKQSIYLLGLRDKWIVRKNQRLFDMILQYFYKNEAEKRISPIERDWELSCSPESSRTYQTSVFSEAEASPPIEVAWDFSDSPEPTGHLRPRG